MLVGTSDALEADVGIWNSLDSTASLRSLPTLRPQPRPEADTPEPILTAGFPWSLVITLVGKPQNPPEISVRKSIYSDGTS